MPKKQRLAPTQSRPNIEISTLIAYTVGFDTSRSTIEIKLGYLACHLRGLRGNSSRPLCPGADGRSMSDRLPYYMSLITVP